MCGFIDFWKKWYSLSPKGRNEYHFFFFKSQLIHTFTESKDINCFILYFEEIVLFWNKKLHVYCPEVVLHYCMHHHCYLNLYHLIYFAMFRPTKWQILVLGTGGTFCFCIDGCGKLTTFVHWLIKIEYSKKKIHVPKIVARDIYRGEY